eukprot:1202673-Amphidinium_carterae.2
MSWIIERMHGLRRPETLRGSPWMGGDCPRLAHESASECTTKPKRETLPSATLMSIQLRGTTLYCRLTSS